jgi:hypothetical protein
MVDMDFGEGKADAAREICTALGVPHILVVPGAATYNNVREAKLELWEDTVLPLLDQVVDGHNHWLAPRFGDGLMLKPDLDSVSALEPRREIKRNTTTTLYEKGLIDVNEAREALDYGEREPGAVGKVDASVLTALLGAVAQVGISPLIRYMKTVGLFDASMTEADILAEAMALAEQGAADEADAALQDPEQDTETPDGDEPPDDQEDENDPAAA